MELHVGQVWADDSGEHVIIATRETEEQNGEADGWRAQGGGWHEASTVAVWMPLPSPPPTGASDG